MNKQELIAGGMTVLSALVVFHWRTWIKLDYIKKRWAIEHEILVDDYCERKKIRREDLPTRHNGAL